jgi:hypothetical protein
MNKYLKSASDRFKKIKEKDYAIAPMSEIDCEVVVEVSELLKKCGKKDAVEILKQYKYLKDDEIRDQLIQCNIDSSSKNYEEGGESEVGKLLAEINELKEKLEQKKKFIQLKDDSIAVNLIFGFKTETYCDADWNFTGKLILNPVDRSATKIPLYANYEIEINDEDEFEEFVEDFVERMKSSNIEFVSNQEEDDDN